MYYNNHLFCMRGMCLLHIIQLYTLKATTSSSCTNMPPTAFTEKTICTSKGDSKFDSWSICSDVMAYFKFRKSSSHLIDHTHLTSYFNESVNATTLFEYPTIKFLQWLENRRNVPKSFTLHGVYQLIMSL